MRGIVHQNSSRLLPHTMLDERIDRCLEQFYKNTTLRHQVADRSFEYAGRDLFQDVEQPARKRGMKVYARIQEGASPTIHDFRK